MAQVIQAIRGMNDVLPQETALWQYLEAVVRRVVAGYGYQEIRLPVVEKTELFKRSIGEVTDIVEKEMYTFDDRNGDSLTLRPEGTACCVRAGIEHGLLYNQIQRLWYMGPMFRHERPQKGRYRQFQQIGLEAFGIAGPMIDAEIILLTARLWRELGLQNHLTLQLNSLGSLEARAQYRAKLVDYFQQHHMHLDEDSKRRLQSNPLRILDSKNPDMVQLLAEAPQLLDYLDAESAEHFAAVQHFLKAANIEFEINPRLVRGLDYYNRTVFEWVVGEWGAQNTVCAGGRYDGLVAQLGGHPTPAVGFAAGLERIIHLLAEIIKPDVGQVPHAYFIMVGAQAHEQGLCWAEQLRDQFPELMLITDCTGGSFKSQFKRADKSGARFALILGDDEVQTHSITIKNLREVSEQKTFTRNEIKEFFEFYRRN